MRCDGFVFCLLLTNKMYYNSLALNQLIMMLWLCCDFGRDGLAVILWQNWFYLRLKRSLNLNIFGVFNIDHNPFSIITKCFMDGRTDGRTDRRTDGQTDGRTGRQTPLQSRETLIVLNHVICPLCRVLLFLGAELNAESTAALLRSAAAIEEGRIICRDIGGADPERMAAPKVADYVQEVFAKVRWVQGEVLGQD